MTEFKIKLDVDWFKPGNVYYSTNNFIITSYPKPVFKSKWNKLLYYISFKYIKRGVIGYMYYCETSNNFKPLKFEK